MRWTKIGLVLGGGLIVSPGGVFRADLRVAGGVVSDVGLNVTRDGDEYKDVAGKYLLPGGVDAHTHFDLPLPDGTRTADSF